MSTGRRADLRFSGAFAAEARELRTVRDKVAAVARDCGIAESEVHGLRLAVTEVMSNAITHAYGQAEPREGAEVRVQVFHRADELLVVVADDGPGMSPRLESPGLGLGLPMVAAMTKRLDIVSSEGGGTEMHLVFPCP